MDLHTLNERERRRPEWQPGAAAVLADGGEWTVPVPRMQVLPEPEAGLRPRLWLGSDLQSNWFRASVEHIDATTPESDFGAKSRAYFGLLLGLNYRLSADELLALTSEVGGATLQITEAVSEALALPFTVLWSVQAGCANPELN